MSDKLKLSLMENAHDFMVSATDYAMKDDTKSWKYALLHLHSGLELLLKARLAIEHWSLLFAKIDEASLSELQKGTFKGVAFDQLLDRLKKISSVDIPFKVEKELKRIRKKRNQLQHFTIEIHIEQLKSLVAKGINIFIQFYEYNFDYDENFVFDLSKRLMEFNKFVKLRMQSIKEELDSSDRPHKVLMIDGCHDCLQDALVIDKENDLIKCLFCGFEMSPEEFAQLSEGSAFCPECERETLGFVLYNNDEGEFICVLCGFRTEYIYETECSSCGRKFWYEDWEMPICKACWDHLVSKD